MRADPDNQSAGRAHSLLAFLFVIIPPPVS